MSGGRILGGPSVVVVAGSGFYLGLRAAFNSFSAYGDAMLYFVMGIQS